MFTVKNKALWSLWAHAVITLELMVEMEKIPMLIVKVNYCTLCLITLIDSLWCVQNVTVYLWHKYIFDFYVLKTCSTYLHTRQICTFYILMLILRVFIVWISNFYPLYILFWFLFLLLFWCFLPCANLHLSAHIEWACDKSNLWIEWSIGWRNVNSVNSMSVIVIRH